MDMIPLRDVIFLVFLIKCRYLLAIGICVFLDADL